MKKILLCILTAITVCCLFSACEKDDASISQKSFVGAWEGNYNTEWVFTRGGTLTICYKSVNSVYSGTYSYNKNQNTLSTTLTERDGERVHFSSTYLVQSFSEEQIVLIDINGGGTTTLIKD